MSTKAFKTELVQFQTELNTLYQKAQTLFLRHGDVAPHAEKGIMPHLDTARDAVKVLLKPEQLHPEK